MMQYNLKLSIIIPFYNVEEYLPQCLDSVFGQDIDQEEYEVICVDDNSQDNCKKIVKKYQKQHSNLILIEHKINKMLGAARNTGLLYAQGQYVWFVDSDDCIKPNILSLIIGIIKQNNLDIIYFDHSRDHNIVLSSSSLISNYKITNGQNFLESSYNSSFAIFTAWSKIIRIDLILQYNCFFAEGVYFEDGDNIVKLLYYAKEIIYIQSPIYYYRSNNKSIMNSSISGKKYADMIKMGARKLLFSEQIKEESPTLALKIRQDAIWNATAVKRILFLKHKERIKFYKELNHKQFIEIKKGNRSIYLRVLFFCPALINILFYFISPILRLLKQYKNEIRHYHRWSR
jgi:glycosyltransferase involved in cell wall biosynthesis